MRSVMSTLAVIVMTVMAMGMLLTEEHLASVKPTNVCKGSILNVAAEKTLFAEGMGVFARVNSPAHHAAEEKRARLSYSHLLVEVILKKFLGAYLSVHFF